MNEKIVIGVTECSKYQQYSNWIAQFSNEVEVVKLDYHAQNLEAIKKCNGVLLTGGEDVHPRFYNKPEYYSFCYEDDINEQRDAFEWKLLEYTEHHALPVLGICRGLQLANVFFGGTLIPDIPTWGKFSHSKTKEGKDKYHPVQMDTSSWLHTIVQAEAGVINSNHHQSADSIGKGLVVSALSPDGVVEGLERKETASSFLCLVQWHPERMLDQESPFVRNIRQAFLEAAKKVSR